MSSKIRLKGRYYRQHPPGRHLGHAEEALELGLDNTAFFLVDVYGKGYDPDHDPGNVPELYRAAVLKNREIVVDHIRPAKDAAKRLGLPVVYVTNYLAPSTNEQTEWRKMSIRTCGVDVLDAWPEPNDILAFSEVIAPDAGDYVVKKQMYSGFFETHLDSLLRSLGIYNLVTVGFDTRICLGTTVTEAMYRNYRVIVLRDCCSTVDYPETQAEGLADFFGIRFIEANVGYTSTSDAFVHACGEV
ncbi:MAG: cysteine hydrolase [Gemmatimonadetes bacterium]|nr:cysteine hydrolase [Gemmatimonadota bacterium]